MQGIQPQKCFSLITNRSVISSKLYERTRWKLADSLIVWQYMPMPCHIILLLHCYESHLWDLFVYGAVDADFAGPAVMLWCPDIL